ncbi:hypothetical protein Wcon_00930 [Wolbachia endosymbiont of Cylisticus convexus]|uniref:hypothetical protein n=1 Tax=Wolbachia endosymbiont of Cylisticus convexus TaxID=118728 RepID=UPI000DF6B133|nr:hypothetical protein [Wolbachia endosymbiont of Cylisticus convexus]RDD34967.1 hypothetical protein Wcon_00930 [Wolbachia endosymbiont of Cylisticus convexus]
MIENNEINDDFYAESVEKTRNILDEAIAKGHTISDDDRQTLEMVKANEQFAEKVLNGEDYQDLQDFCDTLTVSKVRYINEQIAKGKNKTSFVKKLADIAKDDQLSQELRSKPLSKFKEEVGDLKQGLHKSSKATAIPTNYKHSNVPNDFEEEFKQVQNYFRTRGY